MPLHAKYTGRALGEHERAAQVHPMRHCRMLLRNSSRKSRLISSRCVRLTGLPGQPFHHLLLDRSTLGHSSPDGLDFDLLPLLHHSSLPVRQPDCSRHRPRQPARLPLDRWRPISRGINSWVPSGKSLSSTLMTFRITRPTRLHSMSRNIRGCHDCL